MPSINELQQTAEEACFSSLNWGISDLIRKKNIALYSQMILDSTSCIFPKMEILTRIRTVRWHEIAPSVFLQVIEKYWLQRCFDLIVLEKAVELINSLPTMNNMEVLVNLDKRTVSKDSSKISDLISSVTNKSSKILIELTETDLCSMWASWQWFKRPEIHNNDEFTKSLKHGIEEIKSKTGCWIVLDDFPTGSNCIYTVSNIDGIDIVKFDWVFVETLYDALVRTVLDPERAFITHMRRIIREIKSIRPNVEFVAEKIEDTDKFEMLKKIWMIRYYQWYLFHKPTFIG